MKCRHFLKPEHTNITKATKVKMSGSEKQSEQEHKHFLHKACN